MENESVTQKETAYFGAGCFWGVEAAFREIEGVVDTAVGYMGGATENPTYEAVCTDETGHAEVVQVTYLPVRGTQAGVSAQADDQQQTTYDKLLKKFWEVHDPTQVNRQGPDVGTQYRSVVFYNTPEQKMAAERSKKVLQESGKYGSQTIATAIEPAGTFNRAEEYHQQYLAKRGQKVCH